jgi:hypothetical protein
MVNDSVEMLSRYHMYLISYQANEQFVLDHCVQLNITHVSLPKGGTGKRCDYVDTERFLKDKRCIIQIQNKDEMCCARAIVTAKAKIDGHEQWNSIQRGRRIQEELALELHTKAGVPLHQCGIEDVKAFQRFLVLWHTLLQACSSLVL